MNKKTGLMIIILGVGIIIGLIPFWKAIFSPGEHSAAADCRNYLKQIGCACLMYSVNNNAQFPDKLIDLVPQIVSEDRLFKCRWVGRRSKNPHSFVYFSGLSANAPPEMILAYCPYHEATVPVLYADGHVVWEKENEFIKKVRSILYNDKYNVLYSNQAIKTMRSIIKEKP